MKKLLLLLLPVVLVLSACDDYGKKVSVGKSEVFYKGDGVSQKDAEKVGDFLVKNKVIDKDKESSGQVTKDGGKYVVRLVMDAKSMDPAVKLNMWKLQGDLSRDVFNGADARFAFTDNHLEEKELLGPVALAREGNTSVTYDSRDFSKESMQDFAKFLLNKGLLTADKQADLMVRKEGSVPVVRLVVMKDYMKENEAAVLPVFGYWQYLVQREIPDLKNATFWLTTTEFEDYKKVPVLTKDEVAQFENSQTGAQSSEAQAKPAAVSQSETPATQNR